MLILQNCQFLGWTAFAIHEPIKRVVVIHINHCETPLWPSEHVKAGL